MKLTKICVESIHVYFIDFDGVIDIYRTHGAAEPYAYMVYSAFLESWASKKASSDIPAKIGNISDFLSSNTLKTVLEDHCS